ncbi:unnamed protein product [Rotaria socialis]
MSSATTVSSIHPREVWIKEEGCSHVCLIIDPQTKIIEDIKRLVLGDSRKHYQAFYLQQLLAENVAIPTDVSFENPIQLNRIINRSSIPSNEYDSDALMNLQFERTDERRTNTLLDNRQQLYQCNKYMGKWQTNCLYRNNPDGANSIGSSRDCLLSTDTSSGTWTYHRMLREAASYVWRRMSNGNATSYKSKSE